MAHLNQYTWLPKGEKTRIIRPDSIGRIGMISALSSTGDTYTVLRAGTNRHLEFYNFIVALDKQLRKEYRPGFKQNLILIMDNASIHKNERVQKMLRSRGLMVVTTPPYTPDYNVIERLFRVLKTQYSRSTMINRTV